MSNSTRPKFQAPLARVRGLLRQAARPRDVAFLQRFFKTGPGEYAEGDRFLGVRVPAVRLIVRQSDALNLDEVLALLRSPYHEERLLALLVLVRRFQRGGLAIQERVFHLYLRHTRFINNWDLVDVSAPQIVGAWLLQHPRTLLGRLVRSASLWERRIAVLASFTFIRQGQFADTFRLCRQLLQDDQDLMHKACGWMLREIGKRDKSELEEFLRVCSSRMPRTMLRYAIELLPEVERRAWLELPRLRPARVRGAPPRARGSVVRRVPRGRAVSGFPARRIITGQA